MPTNKFGVIAHCVDDNIFCYEVFETLALAQEYAAKLKREGPYELAVVKIIREETPHV